MQSFPIPSATAVSEDAAFLDQQPALTATQRRRPPLWLRWTLACGAGEMIGLVYPALAAIVLAAAFGGVEPQHPAGKLAVLAVMILAGGLEGATLALFQARVLSGLLPGFRVRAWVGVTAAIAMLGWAAGMGMALFAFNGVGAATPPPEPSLALVLLYAGGFGAAAGFLFGFGQWLVLRRYAEGGRAWIAAWSAAWAVAMVLIFAIAGLQTETTPAAAIIAGAAVAGAAAGLAIGAITSLAVTRLKPRRAARPGPAPRIAP